MNAVVSIAIAVIVLVALIIGAFFGLFVIISISVTVLIALIVGGFVFGLYGLTLGRVKHGEEIVQAENDLLELRASNPEYNFESYELDDGTIKFVHNQIDATAIFDPDKKLLHLKSPDRKDTTEDCRSQEDAEMAFEDYLRGIYEPNPVEPPDFSKPYPTPKDE